MTSYGFRVISEHIALYTNAFHRNIEAYIVCQLEQIWTHVPLRGGTDGLGFAKYSQPNRPRRSSWSPRRYHQNSIGSIHERRTGSRRCYAHVSSARRCTKNVPGLRALEKL